MCVLSNYATFTTNVLLKEGKTAAFFMNSMAMQFASDSGSDTELYFFFPNLAKERLKFDCIYGNII